jgi:two-component system sensor histidine kinase ChiS
LRQKVNFRRIIIAGLAGVLLMTVIYHLYPRPNNQPECENGYLDLSGWDFSRDGNVKLDGTWEFYPNVLWTAEDISRHIEKKTYIRVPGRWMKELTEPEMGDQGVGTYRLRVKVNRHTGIYGLKTINIRSSFRIYVNGTWAGARGNPAYNMEEGYRGEVIPSVFFLPLPEDAEVLDIIIQVANLDYYNGGIIQNIYLGSQKQILNEHLKSIAVDIMTVSFLLLSSTYYLIIFFKKKEERKFIYISLACLSYAFITLTGNEKTYSLIITSFPYLLMIRLRIAVVCFSIAIVCLFIREMCRDLIPRRWEKVIVIVMLLNMTAILVIPSILTTYFELVIAALNTLAYISLACLLARAVLRNRHAGLSRMNVLFILFVLLQFTMEYISLGLYLYSVITSTIVSRISLLMILIGVFLLIAEQYSKAYSELERLSNHLIAADRIKDEFLLNTSHEFKTPLHAIINMSQSLMNQGEHRSREECDEYLTYIMSVATRLSHMVNDIIDFENLKNRKLKFHNKCFDINGTIQAVMDVLKYMKKGDGIKLINSIPVGKYYTDTDEDRLKQILVNLIGNALKHTEQGFVEVFAEENDKEVLISIMDTGEGMDEAVQKEIFTRTSFGEKEEKPEGFSGLGLTISKLLADNMGGDLYLKWSEPEKGSIFVLRLPLTGQRGTAAEQNILPDQPGSSRAATGKPETAGAAASAAVIPGGRGTEAEASEQDPSQLLTILLVDDDASNIRVLEEIFARQQCRTLIAYNGTKALELIRSHKNIDIVLLDVMMPGLSGYEVTRKIREKHTIFELPILLLTVRNTPEEIETGLEAGANDFLTKPFNGKELLARVKTLQKMKEAVKNALKLETVFLQSQIKPHFLYNSLNVIMSLCYTDGERAGTMLGYLGNYLRGILGLDPHNSFISIKRELMIVESYVELEKARFGERLSVSFHVDEEILNYRIPALTIQPIVENAIRHGLMQRLSGGAVKLTLRRDEEWIKISIQDDGLGIPPDKLPELLNESVTGSIGLKNVNKRLLNEYGQGLIIRSREGEGTTVTMSVPVKAAYIMKEESNSDGTAGRQSGGYDESIRR